MYVFNRIMVNSQLPKRINKMTEISNNLWWSWNTEYLRLFRTIDVDLWESSNKNPVKFLKAVSQEKLEEAAKNIDFLKDYDKVVENYEAYMSSKNTWFSKQYPNYTKSDVIAYYSAEYGLDQILPIYSGGLGILSGDHLKSASDLGIPLVAVGLLYKNGYFNQKINAIGQQESEYYDLDIYNLPMSLVKDEKGEDLVIDVKMPKRRLYLKAWQINVGRVKLYLLDSDNELNHEEDRDVTLRLYGGDQEMRIRQEIVLGMGGTNLLRKLGLNPTIYHMNEGHSAFLTLEVMKDIIHEKKVSFDVARDIASSKTVFTTHTPVPAGNDIFPISLVEKYFKDFWPRLGISREEFLKLGMKPCDALQPGFNMGILALKIAGKKNGVSKLHGEVSRELFSEIWPDIAAEESPITYVTNGIHTCSWLSPSLKDIYNKYLMPYWQDNMHEDYVWERVKTIPDDLLWKAHMERKVKLLKVVKENVTARLRRNGMKYEDINEITSKLNPNALTIGFARRFATYKRATLIFKDLERITQILNDEEHPIQLIFAGKAHPADREGQDLIKYIHEISLMPQFKGKIFLLENYNIEISRYLVSGVDVWLNTPRRPMEASGTSGQKAAANGVINFSVLDGWWAEGYNGKNGWPIGSNNEYSSYEIQDRADSDRIYETLEQKIIPIYYDKDKFGISKTWLEIMKETIATNAGKYSTARMLVDYTNNLYVPLIKLTNENYTDLNKVTEYNGWKKELFNNWKDIKITQENNADNILIDAGNQIEVKCQVELPNISIDSVRVEAYTGRISRDGSLEKVNVIEMKLAEADETNRKYTFVAKIDFCTGGNYGYTFRIMPKNEMLLDSENLNLIKWIEQ